VLSVSGQVGGGVFATTAPGGAVTVSSVLQAGPGLSITPSTTDESQIINNTGVLSVVGGTGIVLSGGNDFPQINNSGVLSIEGQTGPIALSGLNNITIGSTGVGNIQIQGPAPVFCCYSSDQTQLQTAASTPRVLAHNTEEFMLGGFSLDPSGNIKIPIDGYYNVSTSLQLDKSGGNTSGCDFWFRKNGVDLPRTGSQVTVAGVTGETLANVTTILKFSAGEILSVVFASTDATMAVTAFPASTSPYTRPAIPSIITSLSWITA
jgi:hypothetical protein